ncbi:MAG: ATP-binding protein, partial [Acidimicrobiales bacterium]
GLATSILGMVGVDADPLASREHILISNLLTYAWSQGEDLTLAELIGQIQHPPLRKLGVIDLDSFYPAADRTQLAMKLNGLAASPAYTSWTQGADLDISSLLYSRDGSPRCAVISIAHLSDDERQFVVTLTLSKLITWMRSQSGTSDLRALVYMDEVFGFVPPSAAPPAKKPILTILKQARAFGVGMVLSTQNPVDLDYKAISNAGTWMIGRLQTERDKARLLEGMTSAAGTIDIGVIDSALSGLGKREFLLHSTKRDEPSVFGTRWAMSYLAGPLTREQITALMTDQKETLRSTSGGASAVPKAEEAPGQDDLAEDETNTPPPVAEGVEVAYLDPGTPWMESGGVSPGPRRLTPGLAARVHMLFDDTKADLRHEEQWETVLFPISGEQADMEAAVDVDYDDRDLVREPPPGATYVLTSAKIHTKTFFANAKKDLRDRLYRHETLDLLRNVPLKAYSRPGEALESFEARCQQLADDRADQDVDKIRASIEEKIDRVRVSISTAEDRLREAESRAKTSRDDELMSGVGDVLGGLLGGKKSSKSVLGGLRRASTKRRTRQSAAERVRTAENRVEDKIDQLEDLEEELIEAIEDIVSEWDEKALEITDYPVPLEKTDILVEDIVLVWMATA